ncbi:MAG: MFS transporter [Planctomycetota bacterium]|nr:MFS transporter [Planctomycetota bacterium]
MSSSSSDPGHEPDLPGSGNGRSQERMAILALALAAFVLNLNVNVLGALLPHLGELVPPDGDGLLLAAAAAPSAVTALVTGMFADRFGRRRLMLGGLLLFLLASLLHLLVETYSGLLVVRALSGAGVGMAYACASALVAEIVPYARRGAAMGAFSAGMFLALPVGLSLANEFAKRGSWRGIFVVQAVVAVFCLLLTLRAIAPSRASTEEWVNPRKVFASPCVLPAMLAVMLQVGAFFATVQLSTQWLDQEGLVAKEDQSLLWIVLGLAAAVGSLCFGPLADRLGKRNFVLMSSAVAVGCFLLLARVESFFMVMVTGLLLALASSARTGPLQALVSGLVPKAHLGTLMGLRAFLMQLGIAGFALLAPWVRDWGGGFAAVLVAGAACQALAYLLIRFGVKESVS